jgi:hypothetical protein
MCTWRSLKALALSKIFGNLGNIRKICARSNSSQWRNGLESIYELQFYVEMQYSLIHPLQILNILKTGNIVFSFSEPT